MNMFVLWLVVAIVIFSGLLYLIGRQTHPNEDDRPMIMFTAFVASVIWPLILIVSIIAAPFYVPYKLGVKHREKDMNKKRTWETLKK